MNRSSVPQRTVTVNPSSVSNSSTHVKHHRPEPRFDPNAISIGVDGLPSKSCMQINPGSGYNRIRTGIGASVGELVNVAGAVADGLGVDAGSDEPPQPARTNAPARQNHTLRIAVIIRRSSFRQLVGTIGTGDGRALSEGKRARGQDGTPAPAFTVPPASRQRSRRGARFEGVRIDHRGADNLCTAIREKRANIDRHVPVATFIGTSRGREVRQRLAHRCDIRDRLIHVRLVFAARPNSDRKPRFVGEVVDPGEARTIAVVGRERDINGGLSRA